MELLDRITLLEAKQKSQAKKIQRLEAELKPKKEKEKAKRKSKYVPKIKITHKLTKAEIHERIDNRFLRKAKVA